MFAVLRMLPKYDTFARYRFYPHSNRQLQLRLGFNTLSNSRPFVDFAADAMTQDPASGRVSKTMVTLPQRFGEVFEYSVHRTSRIMCRDLELVFPDADIPDLRKRKASENGKLTLVAIPTCQRARVDLVNWGEDVAKEKDDLCGRFSSWSADVVARLQMLGYWGDWIDPCSGLPMNSRGNYIYSEAEGFEYLMRWPSYSANGCKLIRHPDWGTWFYPATLFAYAPLDELIQILDEVSRSHFSSK